MRAQNEYTYVLLRTSQEIWAGFRVKGILLLVAVVAMTAWVSPYSPLLAMQPLPSGPYG